MTATPADLAIDPADVLDMSGRELYDRYSDIAPALARRLEELKELIRLPSDPTNDVGIELTYDNATFKRIRELIHGEK